MSPDDVRAALASLDTRAQKIVAGMFGVMANSPDKVRDREWMSEQLTQLAILAETPDAEDPQAAVNEVQAYLQENVVALFEASFLLFQRVSIDMSEREGFTFDDAMRQALGYLPPSPD